MSDSAVVTPPTVIPKTVTVDSELVIETVAYMYAVGSLLSSLDFANAAEWIRWAGDKFERTAFDTAAVLYEDDDPLVVAVRIRADEFAAQAMSLDDVSGYDGRLLKVADGYRKSAQKIRESGTIA
jgi:hypothetical protein